MLIFILFISGLSLILDASHCNYAAQAYILKQFV